MWVNEAVVEMDKAAEEEEFRMEEAWDDVKGSELDPKDVRMARNEEIGYMQSRSI